MRTYLDFILGCCSRDTQNLVRIRFWHFSDELKLPESPENESSAIDFVVDLKSLA